MRDKDPALGFDDLPDEQVERFDNFRDDIPVRPVKGKPTPARVSPASSAPANNGMIYGLLALIIAGLAFLSFQLYAQATKLDGRVMELEKRLSSTDESLNQSGAVMQVSIKELKERVLEQESQVAKLWTSAKKNQAAIEVQGQQDNVLGQKVKAQGEQVLALVKSSDDAAGEIKVLKARSETISDIDAKVKENAQTIASLKKQMATLEKENDGIARKVEQNSGWIESNNAFRQQTNQSLNRLEQQIKSLQSGGSSTVNH